MNFQSGNVFPANPVYISAYPINNDKLNYNILHYNIKNIQHKYNVKSKKGQDYKLVSKIFAD